METKQLEKFLKQLQNNYKFIFSTDEGKEVLSDLEKRCHYHSTTNVKGDSHVCTFMAITFYISGRMIMASFFKIS